MQTARDQEAALLKRCAQAAIQRSSDPAAIAAVGPRNDREANVFYVAGTILGTRFDTECNRLVRLSRSYFAQHPQAKISPSEVVRCGWIIGFSRLRDQLERRLDGQWVYMDGVHDMGWHEGELDEASDDDGAHGAAVSPAG